MAVRNAVSWPNTTPSRVLTWPPPLTANAVLTSRAGERPAFVTVIFAVTVAPGAACGAHTETPRSADCPTFSKSKVVPLTRSWSTPPTNPAAPLPWLTPTAFTTASGKAAFTCANVAVKPRSPNRLGMPGRPTAPLTDQPPPAVDGVHRCHWYGATRTPLFLGSHASVANAAPHAVGPDRDADAGRRLVVAERRPLDERVEGQVADVGEACAAEPLGEHRGAVGRAARGQAQVAAPARPLVVDDRGGAPRPPVRCRSRSVLGVGQAGAMSALPTGSAERRRRCRVAAKSAPATANVIAATAPRRRAVDGGRSIGTACLPGG